jgi:RNA polymerase sigma-70 factor (sigma-E family)
MDVLLGRRRDHEASFREAFAELFPLAYRVAWRLLGNAAAAEDVAAEALARAFARWPHVRALPYRDAWVLRVAANLSLDALRRRPPQLDPQHARDPSDAAATRLALGAALRALPPRQRDAVVLRYLHGYSEAEVASVLGVAPGTVKTHVRRGLDALRSRLGDDFEGISNAI